MTLEIRIYIWLFLALNILMVLGVLRIYNAIRVNSGYLLRLKQALTVFQSNFSKAVASFTKSAKAIAIGNKRSSGNT
jgi:hypothetical protein